MLVRAFPVGERVCTITIPRPKAGEAIYMTVEWDPSMPRRLSESEWHEYRAGRDAALAEVAKMRGGSVLCVEI